MSSVRPGGRGAGFPHGGHHLVHRRRATLLPGDFPAIYQDRQLAFTAVHQLDLEPGFVPQGCRHTGGVLAKPGSDWALPNDYLLHDIPSFHLVGHGGKSAPGKIRCRSRAILAPQPEAGFQYIFP